MTVKEKRGRRRYMVFKVSPGIDKGALIRKANSVCGEGESLYVVQCESGMAIARCSPEQRERCIELMLAADPGCVPMLTSGTLRTLREKFPELKVPSKKRG